MCFSPDEIVSEGKVLMSNASFFDMARNRIRNGVAELDQKRWWYFSLGVLLVLLGASASYSAVATTLVSVVFLGWILLAAGAGMVILSFLTGRWSGFLLTLAAGVLSIIAGIATLSSPLSGAAAITLMIGAILIAAGSYRSIASVVMQFPNWGWALLSGIVSFALGVMLVRGWQTTSLFFLGLVIGIDLILHGVSWIMFSLSIHNLAGNLGIRETDRRRAA
jgi:uncharacterized membrane protein HdeD (DUF308 family)